MTQWTEFALAYAAFGGSHFLPARGGLRARLIGAVGRRAYFTVYGVVSLLGLVWLIAAAGRAPFVALWPPEPWTRWVPNLIMPVAMVLTLMAFGNHSPFTLGSRREAGFDPEIPGLAALSRHPLPLALAMWSGAHLLPNGDLTHVLLFGGFAGMSLAAIPVFDRRARLALSEPEAAALFLAAPLLRPAVVLERGWRQRNGRGLVWRLVLAVLIWGAALALHQPLIGVSPFV